MKQGSVLIIEVLTRECGNVDRARWINIGEFDMVRLHTLCVVLPDVNQSRLKTDSSYQYPIVCIASRRPS